MAINLQNISGFTKFINTKFVDDIMPAEEVVILQTQFPPLDSSQADQEARDRQTAAEARRQEEELRREREEGFGDRGELEDPALEYQRRREAAHDEARAQREQADRDQRGRAARAQEGQGRGSTGVARQQGVAEDSRRVPSTARTRGRTNRVRQEVAQDRIRDTPKNKKRPVKKKRAKKRTTDGGSPR